MRRYRRNTGKTLDTLATSTSRVKAQFDILLKNSHVTLGRLLGFEIMPIINLRVRFTEGLETLGPDTEPN
jgi:hypothetical protein